MQGHDNNRWLLDCDFHYASNFWGLEKLYTNVNALSLMTDQFSFFPSVHRRGVVISITDERTCILFILKGLFVSAQITSTKKHQESFIQKAGSW